MIRLFMWGHPRALVVKHNVVVVEVIVQILTLKSRYRVPPCILVFLFRLEMVFIFS